ncbi:MAG: phytanoyl-CoA dioxygenase [Alphaproteobacteria bacterium]|nr:phytanoyl-CoA dioxygenase [Alphaproteobacteria bacterium]
MTAAAFPAVRGLEAYWAHASRQPGAGEQPHAMVSPLLSMLGLGFDETAAYLGEQPPFAAFVTWILERAGVPDPPALERYNAVYDGAEPPEPVRRQQRALAEATPVLDEADLAAWERDGYLILRNAVTPEQALAAEKALWEHIGAAADDPETWYRRSPGGIMVQLYRHPFLEPARRSPRVHKAFAQLWGREDLWMHVDRLSFNPPVRQSHPFQGPSLHWDVSLARPIPFATQGILYLTDTAADQGALQLVPGFHHRIGEWLDSLGDADPRRVDLSGDAVTIAGGAGDLIIWRWDLPHGASPNRARRPRMAQYVNMYPADLATNPVWW